MEPWSTRKEHQTQRRKSDVEIKNYPRVGKSDILSDIMPIYHLSKICGILPVRFTLNRSGRYSGQVDYPQVGYGITLLLALMGSQCYGIYDDLRDGWQKSMKFSSTPTILVTLCDLVLSFSTAVVVIIGSPYRWRFLQRAFNRLVDVDEKLGASVTTTASNVRKLSVIVICCTITWLICLLSLDFFSSTLPTVVSSGLPLNYAPMYLMSLIILCLQLQYAVVLFNVGERFRKLNEFIENLSNDVVVDSPNLGRELTRDSKRRTMQSVLSDLEERRSNEEDSDVHVERVDQLITLHGGLCNSVKCVNKAYGMAILPVALSCLVYLTITAYYLYNSVNSPKSNWSLLTVQLISILFNLFRLLIFIQPCHMVAVKAKRTGALVNLASTMDWSSKVKIQFRIFSIQVLQRPIQFTACGLFYLDRSLLTSLVGSATTYLVILVQFQTSEDPASTENLIENISELIRNVSSFKKYLFSIK